MFQDTQPHTIMNLKAKHYIIASVQYSIRDDSGENQVSVHVLFICFLLLEHISQHIPVYTVLINV